MSPRMISSALAGLALLSCLPASANNSHREAIEARIRPVGQVNVAAPAEPPAENQSQAASATATTDPAPATSDSTTDTTPPTTAAVATTSNAATAATTTTAMSPEKTPAGDYQQAFSKDELAVGEATYQKYCQSCHLSGAAGAPIVGSSKGSAQWAPRLQHPFAELVASVMNGKGYMPAKGLCMKCSKDDFFVTVYYMVQQVKANAESNN